MVRDFFINMRCGQCSETLKEDSASILREESNCLVIRITCSNCGKSLGIALMGFDYNLINENEDEEESCEISIMKNKSTSSDVPINYDDVIDAHNFFFGLDKDWIKHIKNYHEGDS